MKARDSAAVAALRSVLGAIDNADAPDSDSAPEVQAGVIAGGVVGLGAGEVARRELSTVELEAILHREVAERRAAVIGYRAGGQADAASTLEAEALVIDALLRDSGDGG